MHAKVLIHLTILVAETIVIVAAVQILRTFIQSGRMTVITTQKKWEEVLLPADAQQLTQTLNAYLHGSKARVAGTTTGGCSLLFYGSDADTRRDAAALAGTHIEKPVYRIETPGLVAEYIRETEKNINAIFMNAAQDGAILFFDAADSLFNKRTDIKDSHEKYANEEADYLLQQINKHPHPVIVAVAHKEKVAADMLRSFNSIIHLQARKQPNHR